MISRRILTVIACMCSLAGLGLTPRIVGAQNDARRGPTPPRLRFIDGEVSFWRPGAADWTQAQVNTAIAAGDSLYAGDGGNLEIQIGPHAFVRAGANTQIDLSSLDPSYMQFRITGGHAALDLKALPSGQSIEVDSPNAAFTIDRPGYYRVDIDEQHTAFSAHRGGTATVIPAAGQTTDVADNQQIILEGTDTVVASVNAAPALDEWDRWNDDRTAQLGEAPRSAPYVPPGIAGADDLDRYGDWQEQPRYGHVWVPRNVPPDWAPYSAGRWVYDPYYQWTWVDDAPWGWAPYHYGRWVNVHGFWGWAPGPVVAFPVYSPALVAFFGAPGIGVSVGIGLPFVSWVALGWGEPIIPWWGHRGFVGHPYWGGWGGPRVVNNVVINNTKIVNVTNITRFQNVNVRNAVVAVDRQQFGRGNIEHTRLDPQRVQRLRPVRGDLSVRPVAASLVPREAQGRRPPDRLQQRQVVTTRPPQDPMRRLQAKGIEVTAPASRPEPRVVRPQRGLGGPGAPPSAGVEGGGAASRQSPPEHRGGVSGQPAQPGRPAHGQPPQPVAPDAAKHAVPPPPPRAERAHQERPGHVDQTAPPVSGAQRAEPPARSQAPSRERAVGQQPPSHSQAPAPGRAVEQQPPPPPQAPPPERAIQQPPPAHPQPPPREHAVEQQPPPHSQAPPAERAIQPPPPAHPQPPPRERAVQQQPPSHPQAPPREPAAQQQSSHPQAAPQERAVQQQPPASPQAAPPQERAVRQQPPSHEQAAPPQQRAVQQQRPSHQQAAPAHEPAVQQQPAPHEAPRREQ